MPYTTYAKNAMLDRAAGTPKGFGEMALYVSAHTADPGDTGTNEVTGGSYARKSITWNAPSGGSIDSSNQPVLDIPSGTTVTHIGLFDASTSGNFVASANVTDETFGSDGTYTITDADFDLNA